MDIAKMSDSMSDSMDERLNADVATFTIKLMFRHASIDPASITRATGLRPCRQWRVGDAVVDPVDGAIRGTEKDTLWSYWRRYYADANLQDCLTEFVEPLGKETGFIKKLASESSYSGIVLGFPGQRYYGGSIGVRLASLIAMVGLEIGIEVFPDSAT